MFFFWGGGGCRQRVQWVHLHLLTQRKGPLNLRGRVKMTLRMDEKWASFNTLIFQTFPGKYTPDPLLDADASSARTHPSKILLTALYLHVG